MEKVQFHNSRMQSHSGINTSFDFEEMPPSFSRRIYNNGVNISSALEEMKLLKFALNFCNIIILIPVSISNFYYVECR
jgi:hypothetical protein